MNSLFFWLAKVFAKLFTLFAQPVGLGGGGSMYWPAVSPIDRNVLFVGCDMGGLYRSTDGGLRWTLLDQRRVRGAPAGPIVCDPNDVNVVIVWGNMRLPKYSFLRRSTDQGNVWSDLKLPATATTVTCIAVDRIAVAGTYRLLCGTDVGAFYSDDNGLTWTQAPIAGSTAVTPIVGIIALADPATSGAYLYFLATDAAVFSSTAAQQGSSWQAVGAVGMATIDSFTGASNPASAPSVILYATANGSFIRSTDQGATWSAPLAGSYRLAGTSSGNPQVVYAATVDATNTNIVMKSSDQGQTWTPSLASTNPVGSNGWIESDRGWGFGGQAYGLAVSSSDEKVALIANTGSVYLTIDGSSWREIYSQPAAGYGVGKPWRSIGLEVTTAHSYDIDPSDPQKHYISYTDIGFARSTNGGTDWYYDSPTNPWKNCPSNPWKNSPYNTIYQIAFDPSAPGDFWAAASDVHDIPQPAFLQDMDVNGTWVPRGSGGVVRRSGSTWTNQNAGLPQLPVAKDPGDASKGAITGVPPVVSIVVDPNNASRRWCSVFGQGVFAWDTTSSQWVKRSNGLGFPANDNMNVYRLHYVDDGSANGILFCSVTARRDNSGAFTADSGLFRSVDGALNWTHITAGANIRYAADYAISPGNPNTIFLAAMNRQGADGALYRTTNGLAASPTWSVVFDINSVPSTPIGPLHWPYLGCFSVTIDRSAPWTVFLCTLSHGIWLSRRNGNAGSWGEFSAIPFLPTHRLFIKSVKTFPWPWPWYWRSRENLFITTFGAGAWKVGIEYRWHRWWCRWYWWRWWPCWPWYWIKVPPFWLERLRPWPRDLPRPFEARQRPKPPLPR